MKKRIFGVLFALICCIGIITLTACNNEKKNQNNKEVIEKQEINR